MTRAHIRTRSTTMEARVAALEAANSKTQLLLEAIQRLLEDKFASIDKRLDSIESRRESSDQTCPPPSEEDDGDGCRRRGGLDHRERERVSPLENHMPFIKMDFPRFNDGDDPIGWVYKAEQYFDYFSVPPEKKVKMISFHLDREALQWYQWEECASSCSSWEDFVKVLAPLPIGFAVFMVHLATIPITGTGINPARSLGAAVIYNQDKAWNDHWIFWVGPFIGAAIAAFYHQFILRAGAVKALGSFRSANEVLNLGGSLVDVLAPA